MMDRETYISGYCERSKISRETYDAHRIALPCDCGDPECRGWASVSRDARAVLDHLGFRPTAATVGTASHAVSLVTYVTKGKEMF